MYTAKILKSSKLPGNTTMSVRISVFVNDKFDHEKELDVKAIAYQEGIKTYLREYQAAQEAAAAVAPGEVITL